MGMSKLGLATALVAVGLWSCNGPYDTAISDIDETPFGPDGKRDALAAIQISDPTLYSREALVNDRRRERAYLAEVLEGSRTVEFQSEIRRELLSIFALSARLGVAFDPAARIDFLRQERQANATSNLNLQRTAIAGQQLDAQNRFELERLRQNREINRLVEAGCADEAEAIIRQRQLAEQANLVKLRSELELYQAQLREQRRQIEAYEQAVLEGRPVDATPGDPAEADESSTDVADLPSLPDSPLAGAANDAGSIPERRDSELGFTGNPELATVPNARDIRIETPNQQLDAMFTRLDSQVDRLTALLDKQITTARDVDTTLSPEDEFQARQAYRRTIRSALAENDLDDLHDLDGNSLYRFQFRATILPGEKKNKFGVAKFDIRSPKADRKAVSDLYNSWLGHATYRMNARESSKNSANRGNVGDNTYELLAAGTGLFEIARFAFHPSYGDLSAFDPCRHARGPRQQEALGCEVLAIAVPPGARGLVDAGLANFQDTLLRAVVRALHREAVKTDAAQADLRMGIADLQAIIQLRTKERDDLQRTMEEGEKTNTAPVADGQPPSLGNVPGDDPRTSDDVANLDTEIKKLTEERDKKKGELSSARSYAFKDYMGETGKTSDTEKSCVARLPTDVDNTLGLKRTPRLTDLVEIIIKAAGVDTTKLDQVAGETANLTYLRREFEAATKSTRDGIKIDKVKAPAVLNEYQKLVADLATNPVGADGIRAEMRKIQNEVMANALGVLNGLTLAQLKSLLHPRLALTLAAEFLNASPAIAKSAEGTVRRYDLDQEQQAKLNALLDQFESGAQSARDFLRFFFSYHDLSSCRHVVAGRTQDIDAKLDLRTEVPERFCEALFVDKDAAAGLCAGTSSEPRELDGDGYAYTTQPVERSQRVSTIASAAEAYEFALALALQAPQAALGLNGGLGASRLATGKVQARENVPLVVGYSNSGDGVESTGANSNGSFGWVFGPRFQLDPSANELKLVQHVKPYDVTADLSVPGWWPHVDLALDTVWNGNWRDGEKLIDAPPGGQRIVRVPLRNNRADMDGLTNHVSKKLLGRSLQATHVSRVVPHTLSRCVDNANLLVYGSNIWRSTEVFLNGVRASDDTIKVLPDMEGISVGFPSSAYRVVSAADGGRARLTVWTRDGFDEHLLPLSGDHTKSPCTDMASSSPPSHKLTAILPNTVSVCSSTTDFIVTVTGMTKAEEKDIAVTFAGDRVAPYEVADFAGGKGVRIRFQGKHQGSKWNGLGSVKVAVASKKGIVSEDVSLVGDLSKCGKAPEVSAKATISSVITSAGTDRIEVCQPSTLVAVAGKNLKGVTLGEWLSKREPAVVDAKGTAVQVRFNGLPAKAKKDVPDGESGFFRLLDSKGETVAEKLVGKVCL